LTQKAASAAEPENHYPTGGFLMQFNNIGAIATLVMAGVTLSLTSIQPAQAVTTRLFGLTDSNSLVVFDPSNPTQTRTVSISGINGTLVGIDFRPADGKLYGVTNTRIYRIDPTTGISTEIAQNPATPFLLDGSAFGVDFNPNPDRLRIVSNTEQNSRLNPNNNGGLAGTDTPLAYAATDTNVGQNPNIAAEAYTNSFLPSLDPTRRTTLYGIDSDLDVLVRQGGLNFLGSDPASAPSPNSGQLFTVGQLKADFGPVGGFDILSTLDSTGSNVDTAFAASGSTAYTINLQTGEATTLGTVGDGSANLVGLAAASVHEPSSISALICLSVLGLVVRRRDRTQIKN